MTTDTDWAVVINGWSVFVARAGAGAVALRRRAGGRRRGGSDHHRLFGLRGERECDRKGNSSPGVFEK